MVNCFINEELLVIRLVILTAVMRISFLSSYL